MLARELAQALTLGAEHERERTHQLRALERGAGFLGETDALKATLAKPGQRLREIFDEDDGHDVERAARGFGKRA